MFDTPANKLFIPETITPEHSQAPENSKTYQSSTKIEEEEIKFNWSYAGKCLTITFTHFFLGPISIPVLKRIFGKYLMKNMLFRLSWVYFLVELQGWLWLASTTILLLNQSENTIYLLPSMVATGIILTLRNILISLKYGYYSDSVWAKFNKKMYSLERLFQHLIVTSWIKVPERVAKRELLASYLRQYVLPDNLSLFFVKESNPATSFNLQSLSEALVMEIDQKLCTHELKFISLLGVVYALLPFPMSYYKHGSEGFDLHTIEYIYLFMCSFISTFMARGFLYFIIIGVYDFSRKRKLMAQCSALVCIKNYSQLLIDCPQIDMHNADSIMSWYYMRTAFLDFGKRYTKRLFMYISLTLPICLGSIVIVFLMMFNVIQLEVSFYFVPGVYLVIVVMGILCYMISAAVELNNYFVLHRDILLSNIAEIRNSEGKYENVTRILWTVIEKLKQDELLRPVKIMGITVDSALYTKLATVAISGFFALIRVFYMD